MFKRMAEFGPDSGGRVKVSSRPAPPLREWLSRPGPSWRGLGRACLFPLAPFRLGLEPRFPGGRRVKAPEGKSWFHLAPTSYVTASLPYQTKNKHNRWCLGESWTLLLRKKPLAGLGDPGLLLILCQPRSPVKRRWGGQYPPIVRIITVADTVRSKHSGWTLYPILWFSPYKGSITPSIY